MNKAAIQTSSVTMTRVVTAEGNWKVRLAFGAGASGHRYPDDWNNGTSVAADPANQPAGQPLNGTGQSVPCQW